MISIKYCVLTDIDSLYVCISESKEKMLNAFKNEENIDIWKRNEDVFEDNLKQKNLYWIILKKYRI